MSLNKKKRKKISISTIIRMTEGRYSSGSKPRSSRFLKESAWIPKMSKLST
jgi:hypothetical protein